MQEEFEAFIRASCGLISVDKVVLAIDKRNVCQGWGWLESDDLEAQRLVNALTWKGRKLYALP
jgi:hypothetical protein